MGPDGDYQPLLPYGNGNQQSYMSPLSAAESSEFDKDKLDLGQILAIARRRALIVAGVTIAVSSAMISKALKEVPNYEGKFQLLVGPVSGEDKVDKLTQALSKTAGLPVDGPDYQTQIQVLWSPQVLSPIVKQIQARYPDINYETLRSKLVISRLPDTKILEVRYNDSDPEKIQFILTQVADGYIKYSQKEQQTTVQQGLTFVNSQTTKLQEQVNWLQDQIQKLRQNYRIIDPESQGQLLTSRVSTLVQQRQETETQLGETQRHSPELQGQ